MIGEGFHYYYEAIYECWNCGRRGRLLRGGPLMICYGCDVMWARWARPVSTVAYAPMYETL